MRDPHLSVNNLKQLSSPTLNGACIESKRAELKAYFNNTWQTYESLFNLISDDSAYYLRPERLRHPLIFYFGHTATFYINKLILGKFISKRLNTKLEAICAVGVDEMSWDDLDVNNYDWPSVDEVRLYRNQVHRLVNDSIDNMPLDLPISQDSQAWIILMGCEHERIHLETSSVIMRMLPLEFIEGDESWKTCPLESQARVNQLKYVAENDLTLGKNKTDHTYGWDNEYGSYSIHIPEFKASQHLVSNAEFMEFVIAGGYQNIEYWSDEGRQWLSFSNANMPRFWLQKSGDIYQRNLLNEIPLPLSWPVEVNHLEASAFCQWKSKKSHFHISLPTEAQWYALYESSAQSIIDEKHFSSNINLKNYASSCPIDSHKQGDFYDVIGNVWQWTNTPIDGFKGFKVHPLYDDFSTPTFDGKHNLIKGGSWISTGNETHISSRYAFRRHFFQHAGFRYVENKIPVVISSEVNTYESDPIICQSLERHYQATRFVRKPYPKSVVDNVLSILKVHSIATLKLLDIGCNVGGVSFLLSPYFNIIDAVDFSAATIKHAVQIQNSGEVRYIMKTQGDLVSYKTLEPNELALPVSKNKLHFTQGDPCNLKAKYKDYDLVIAQYVVDNSYDPRTFFNDIIARINENSYLIIISNYDFNESKTPKNKWLGAQKLNGENVSAFEAIESYVDGRLMFIESREVNSETVIDDRNVNISSSHLTLWKKTA